MNKRCLSADKKYFNKINKPVWIVAVIMLITVGAFIYHLSEPKYPGFKKQLSTYEELKETVSPLYTDILFPDLEINGFTNNRYYLHTISEYCDDTIDGYRVEGKKYINGNGYDYVLSVYEGYNEHSKYEIVNGNKMYIEIFNPHSGAYQLNGEMQINGYTYQINTFIYGIDKTAVETQEIIVIIKNAYINMFEGL